MDAVICEGYEAGGHKGFTELTTLVLTPMVADAVNIPVVTGGVISDVVGTITFRFEELKRKLDALGCSPLTCF